jgi:hypothetical protein
MLFAKREVEVFSRVKFDERTNNMSISSKRIKLKKGENKLKTDMPLFFLISISVSIFVSFLAF